MSFIDKENLFGFKTALAAIGCMVCLSSVGASASVVDPGEEPAPAPAIVPLELTFQPLPTYSFSIQGLTVTQVYTYVPPSFSLMNVIDPNAPVVIDGPNPSTVPLPAGAPLLLAGLAGLALMRKRKGAEAS